MSWVRDQYKNRLAVMIRLGAQGAYVIYFGAPREDAYSGQGAYFFFEKQPKIKKKTL